jgi:hypothetical protein
MPSGSQRIAKRLGIIKKNMEDIYKKLNNPNYSTRIFSKKGGTNRAQDAIFGVFEKIKKGEYDISETKNVFLNISSGNDEITIDEIGIINDNIQNKFPKVNITMGINVKDIFNDIEIQVIFTKLELGTSYVDAKKLFNSNSTNTKTLPIYFLEEEFSNEEVSLLISFISDLYKDIGGDGLKIRGLQSKHVESVLEPKYY